jgi:hypothetical protein
MKLSVSAFQASCSASAQKILQHHAPSYGATSSSAAAVLQPAPIQQSTPPHLAKRPNPTVKVSEYVCECECVCVFFYLSFHPLKRRSIIFFYPARCQQERGDCRVEIVFSVRDYFHTQQKNCFSVQKSYMR